MPKCNCNVPTSPVDAGDDYHHQCPKCKATWLVPKSRARRQAQILRNKRKEEEEKKKKEEVKKKKKR